MAVMICILASSCGAIHHACPTYGTNMATKHGHKAQAKYARGKRI